MCGGVENQKIGTFTCINGANHTLDTDDTGRIIGGGSNGVLLWDTKADGVDHAVVEVSGGAGDGTVSQTGHTVLQLSFLTTQVELTAVCHTATSAGVRYQHHTVTAEHGKG